jgi:enamine deaminase RidA (YjgF/YER057c/UK114 family)
VVSAETRLRELAIELPAAPTPLGAYVEAVQTGNLLFVSGTLPIVDHQPQFVGRLGEEYQVEEGREAARIATLNALAIAKKHLGSLDKVTRVVRLGVSIATAPSFREHPKVADGASELLVSIFGQEKISTRLVFGVASLPLGTTVEIEVILEVEA